MTDQQFIDLLEQLKALLISVSTGGPKIDQVDPRYKQLYSQAMPEFAQRGLQNPIAFLSLWD